MTEAYVDEDVSRARVMIVDDSAVVRGLIAKLAEKNSFHGQKS